MESSLRNKKDGKPKNQWHLREWNLDELDIDTILERYGEIVIMRYLDFFKTELSDRFPTLKSELQRNRVLDIYNNTSKHPKGHVLLMYITHPFFLNYNSPKLRYHINMLNSLLIVKVLNELGYKVDVVKYNDSKFDTNKIYDIIIGIGEAFDYNKKYFTNSRIKIYYATGLHWLTETYLIYERLLNLKNRMKITLIPRRLNKPYFSPEKSDVIFSVQNDFTNKSYLHLNKPIYVLPMSGSLATKNITENIKKKNTKTILWLSGGGMVLKGLDIVLEAFSEMHDFKLIICANVSAEKDFESLYYKQLYYTENIKIYGFVDIGDDEFQKIISECVAIISPYPEGEISGSLINGMCFGLIPIIAYCSNGEIKEFSEPVIGTVNGIMEALKRFGELSDEEIIIRSTKTIEYVKKNYNQINEYDHWKQALEDVINKMSNR
jgi:hypothetical protein